MKWARHVKIFNFCCVFCCACFFSNRSIFTGSEFQKESERIIESKGWMKPEKTSFQEQVQILIDHTNSKNRISIGLLSTDSKDIMFTNIMEDAVGDSRIFSYTLTNQFACAPNAIDKACVIIAIHREGLGTTIEEIKEKLKCNKSKIREKTKANAFQIKIKMVMCKLSLIQI